MILFVGHSLRTMTSSATRSVPLDWQGPVNSYASAVHVAAGVKRQTGVQQASPTATAPFASIVHQAPVGTIRSGAGSILAVPPGYLDHIRTFRFLRGSLKPGQIVFDQQLAATLQVQPGDTVTLTPKPGARPHRFKVGGVALVTAPDVLFQPLNPLLGPAPAQPPADIAILPLATFAQTLAPSLPTVASASAAAAVPGAQRGIQWQVQAQVDPACVEREPDTRASPCRPDSQRRRTFAARTGRLRRQPFRQPQQRGGRRALRGDALHHARRPRRARRVSPRVPGCARHRRARSARPRAAARARCVQAKPALPRRSGERGARPCRGRDRDRRVAACGSGGRLERCRHHNSHTRGVFRLCGARLRRSCRCADRRQRRRSAGKRQRGTAQRAAPRPPALAAAVSRCRLPRRQRADLLADRPHGLLGGRQPGLEPHALPLGVHVLRTGAALAGRDAVARSPARTLLRAARQTGGGRPRDHVARLSARQRRPARRGDQPRSRS